MVGNTDVDLYKIKLLCSGQQCQKLCVCVCMCVCVRVFVREHTCVGLF
jgi:hypothetical protein